EVVGAAIPAPSDPGGVPTPFRARLLHDRKFCDMKFLVRERVFDIGDDFWVTDEQGTKVFWVDGKALRLRTTVELKDPEGELLMVSSKKMSRGREQMRVVRDGAMVAALRVRLCIVFLY